MKKLKKFQLEEMRHHDKEAKFYARRNEKDFIWEVPAEKFLLRTPYIKENDTIIDMGCGPAIFVDRMLKRMNLKDIKYIGIDISSEMLKLAKKRVPKGKFIQGDMENISLRKEATDVVLSLGALHHSENKIKTLKKWLSLLKRQGYILLREPTKESLKKGKGESPNEEGIDVLEIIKFAKENKLTVEKIVFFWSPLFHLVNKALIKIGLERWREIKQLWNMILIVDIFTINLVKGLKFKLNGDSVAIVLKKL